MSRYRIALLTLALIIVVVPLASACQTAQQIPCRYGSYQPSEMHFSNPILSVTADHVFSDMATTRYDIGKQRFEVRDVSLNMFDKEVAFESVSYQLLDLSAEDSYEMNAAKMLRGSVMFAEVKDAKVYAVLNDGVDTLYRVWNVDGEVWLSFNKGNERRQPYPVYVVGLKLED